MQRGEAVLATSVDTSSLREGALYGPSVAGGRRVKQRFVSESWATVAGHRYRATMIREAEPGVGGHMEPPVGGHMEPPVGGHMEPPMGGHMEPSCVAADAARRRRQWRALSSFAASTADTLAAGRLVAQRGMGLHQLQHRGAVLGDVKGTLPPVLSPLGGLACGP